MPRYLQFDNTSVSQLLLQDGRIRRDIGLDLSVGVEYRPFLNNNVILNAGAVVPDLRQRVQGHLYVRDALLDSSSR